jgi:hypothetical protein
VVLKWSTAAVLIMVVWRLLFTQCHFLMEGLRGTVMMAATADVNQVAAL